MDDGRIPRSYGSEKKDTEWAEFEENVPVQLGVEKAMKSDALDNEFRILCKVLNGTQKDKKTIIKFFRKWPSGDWNEETLDFLVTLCPVEYEQDKPIWSYMLVDKVFSGTPYKNRKGYWRWGSIELLGARKSAPDSTAKQSSTDKGTKVPF